MDTKERSHLEAFRAWLAFADVSYIEQNEDEYTYIVMVSAEGKERKVNFITDAFFEFDGSGELVS